MAFVIFAYVYSVWVILGRKQKYWRPYIVSVIGLTFESYKRLTFRAVLRLQLIFINHFIQSRSIVTRNITTGLVGLNFLKYLGTGQLFLCFQHSFTTIIHLHNKMNLLFTIYSTSLLSV